MKVVVTGGGGFLGSRICVLLKSNGHSVFALGRSRYPQLETKGISCIQADIRDGQALIIAFRGIDLVVHSAAMAGIWGKRTLFWDINHQGTRNVIRACRESGVEKLVHTSSPSVVFGSEPLCGVDESQPYPRRFRADYPASKAAAEQSVLEANGPNLATLALRPHLLFGPGDPHLFPRILQRASLGRLVQVGEGTNLVDVTYVDNAAHAHLLAAERISFKSPCGGKSYFISQGQPVCLWPWINAILARVGVQGSFHQISHKSARRMGWLMEGIYRFLPTRWEPLMTRFLADQLAESHYFDLNAARRDLGYEPLISTEAGVDRLVEALRHARIPG